MADTKVSALSGITPVVADVIYVIDDFAGTPTSARCALSDVDTLLSATTKTLTNKTIDSASNTMTVDLSEATVTGTLAEFNTAVSDATLASLAGTETMTNKTLTDPKISHSYNAQTGTTYTLVLTDANKVVSMSNASANTLTIPPNSSVAFPTGTIITIFALGAGTTTVAGGTGVTLSGNGGSGSAYSADIQTRYAAATIIKIGTDSWLISGDIDTVAA